MKKIKKIQGAPAGRVKGSSQGSSLEPLRIRERRDSHGQKPPTQRDPGSRIFFHFFDFFRFLAFSKNIKRFFWFFEKNQKNQKNEKNQKNPGCPRRESQGLQPGLQPGATQDPGEEGFPRPETPHAGRPRVSDFFHFFDVFDFFRFLAFSKKIKIDFFDFFGFSKKMKKIKKIQGAPAGRVKGSSQGSSLDPGEEGFSRPETPDAGRPRVPDFFHFF